jgi:hypothetical protein
MTWRALYVAGDGIRMEASAETWIAAACMLRGFLEAHQPEGVYDSLVPALRDTKQAAPFTCTRGRVTMTLDLGKDAPEMADLFGFPS